MLDSPVSSCVQENLADDGNRGFDEGIRLGLDREYPHWKSPEETYMVPNFFPPNQNSKGASAEKVVYNLLEQLGTKNREPMFVIYSFSFSKHIPGFRRKKSWVMGETDFVIIHKHHGPIVIEVKAAKNSKRYGDAERQLQKDKLYFQKCFEDLAKETLSKKQAEEIFKNFPAFVAMPNCRRPSVCVKDNALYQDDCSSLETFSDWWACKVSGAEHPDVDSVMFELLVMRFVGMSCLTPSFGLRVNGDDKTMLFRTKEQMEILAGCHPPKLWIRGPAGSGKSYLLVLKAVTLAEEILRKNTNEKILVLCFNVVLSKELEKMIKSQLPPNAEVNSFLHVMTFTKLVCWASSGPAPKSDQEKERSIDRALENLKDVHGIYDHIFVDEGQDLYGKRWPELLWLLHKDSHNPNFGRSQAKRGLFWVMYDMNQYLYYARTQTESHFKYLNNSAQLNTVFRNTGNVFEQSKKYFQSSMPDDTPVTLGHKVNGLPISWDDSLVSRSAHEADGPRKIVEWIEKLQQENVSLRDICILVETKEKQRALRELIDTMGVKSQTGDEWVEKSDDVVVVESIRRFKGLERKVVILYNPPFQDNRHVCIRELLYTAVSRCSCYLVVITTTEGCEALKSDAGVYT